MSNSILSLLEPHSNIRVLYNNTALPVYAKDGELSPRRGIVLYTIPLIPVAIRQVYSDWPQTVGHMPPYYEVRKVGDFAIGVATYLLTDFTPVALCIEEMLHV